MNPTAHPLDTSEDSTYAKAVQWRQAFDQSFAAAPPSRAAVLHDFLAITVGGTPYALRLAEVAGLQALSGLTICPSRRMDLLGLSSFRGQVVPVYDLRVLLGSTQHGAGREAGKDVRRGAAWWVIAKGASLGLAFEVFERHLRLPAEALSRPGAADEGRHAAETLRSDAQLRPIVSIASILADIRASVTGQR